jgi:hypothetical protein
MEGVNLGGEDLGIKTKEVIVDSGTSYLLMPTSDFEIFSQYFKERYSCWIDQYYYGLYICNCEN